MMRNEIRAFRVNQARFWLILKEHNVGFFLYIALKSYFFVFLRPIFEVSKSTQKLQFITFKHNFLTELLVQP